MPVDRNEVVQIERLRGCAGKPGGTMVKVLFRKLHSVETRSDFLSSNSQKHGPVRGTGSNSQKQFFGANAMQNHCKNAVILEPAK